MDFYLFKRNIPGRTSYSPTNGQYLPGSSTACVVLPRVDGYCLMEDFILPAIAPALSSIGEYVDIKHPLAQNVIVSSSRRPIYFGNFGNGSDQVRPNRAHDVTWKVTSKQPMKTWVRRAQSGDIVIVPYAVGNVRIVEVPAFDEKDIINRAEVSYTRECSSFLSYDKPPCSAAPLGFQKIQLSPPLWANTPNILIDGVRYPEGRIKSIYERQTIAKGATMWYPSDLDRDLIPAIHSWIEQLKKVDTLTGLTTEVVCEANAGAWDLYTSVVENVRETIPMIFSLLRRILELYQSARGKVRHRRSLSSGSIKEDIATIWLQFRYAISPLALELNDVLTYMDLKVTEYETYRSGLTKELNFEFNGWTGSVDCVDRCMVRNRMSFSHFRGLQLNLANTVWQVIPLSFVVDWVFNIGDVLSTLSAPPGLDSQKISYSSRVSGTMTLKHPDKPGSVMISMDTYSRTLADHLHVGLDFAPNITFKRQIDAWAIFWAGVKKPHRYR